MVDNYSSVGSKKKVNWGLRTCFLKVFVGVASKISSCLIQTNADVAHCLNYKWWWEGDLASDGLHSYCCQKHYGEAWLAKHRKESRGGDCDVHLGSPYFPLIIQLLSLLFEVLGTDLISTCLPRDGYMVVTNVSLLGIRLPDSKKSHWSHQGILLLSTFLRWGRTSKFALNFTAGKSKKQTTQTSEGCAELSREILLLFDPFGFLQNFSDVFSWGKTSKIYFGFKQNSGGHAAIKSYWRMLKRFCRNGRAFALPAEGCWFNPKYLQVGHGNIPFWDPGEPLPD